MGQGSPISSSENDKGSPESSPGIRFITGCILTTAAVTISAATAFWLGNKMLQLIPGNFFGMALSVWLGTIVLFTLNFFQPRLERAIVRDFEEMMLILHPKEHGK
jgi:hypothetical protein